MNDINKPLISVIIPTYNAKEYLQSTLDSITNQTYSNHEIVIVDDGSTDSTWEIIQKFSLQYQNVISIRKEHTGNVGKNSNEAIKLSKGDYFAKLDSDDVWKSDKLEKQIKYMNKYKMVCSNAKIINENGSIINEKYFSGLENDFEIDLSLLLENNYVITSSILCERKLFEKYGGFEEELGFRGEDYTLWLKIASENRICFINEELLSYRIHEKNLSHYKDNERYKLLENTLKIRNYYQSHTDEKVVKAVQKGNSTLYSEMARISFNNKDYKKSLLLYNKMIQIFPNKFSKQFVKILLQYLSAYFFFKLNKSN